MADRSARSRVAWVLTLVLAAAVTLPACGGGARPSAGDAGRPSAADGQREELVKSATAALRRYQVRARVAGVYAGRTARGRRAVVRVSARRRVSFSIVVACRRHPLRAFPNRPPRLRRDGSFSYRERGRGYALRVSGRVRARSARGTLALRGRPQRGPPCRSGVAWRALRR